MRFYAFILLLISSGSLLSQNCDAIFSGKVIDSHDDTLLAGATLLIIETGQSALTDFDGNFSISSLCNASYDVQISHPYCDTVTYTVKINGNTTKTFRLEHHLEELNEVTVKGRAYEKKSNSLVETVISKETLESFSNGSLGDALNSLSGVSSLNTGNTVVKPVINGLHSSRVVIMNNGVRMEDQEWGAEHAPNVDVNSSGNLTVIKGAGALQYSGDAVGGVIISEAAKVPVKDTLYGKTLMTAATNGRGASLSTSLSKGTKTGWYGTVQGTLKRYGDFEAPDYVLSNTGIFERNASLSVGLNKFNFGVEAYYSLFRNEIGILRASHIGGATDQIRAINSNRPLIVNDFTYTIDDPRQDVTHHLARVKGFKRLEGLGKISLQYDFQQNNRLEFDVRRGDDRDDASLDLKLTTHTIQLNLDAEISEKLDMTAGIMTRYQNNFANPDTGVRRLIPDYDRYDAAAYGILKYEINENLIAELGARFDYTYMDVFKFYRTSFWESRNYDDLFPEIVVEELDNQLLTNPQLNFYNPSVTAGATYAFDDASSLFFNYSLASRAPNPSELFSEGLHHSASRIELGDLRFDSETAHKFSVTFQHKRKGLDFSINPYVNSISDFIVIEPTGVQQTIRGNFQVWEYRQTDAQLLGVDVDANIVIDENFSFKHQFSFVKGYDRSRDEPLIDMPPVNTTNEIVYENKQLNKLRLALESQYVFRQNEFPDTNFEVFNPETEMDELVDVSTPPDAYHLLNFKSSMDFNVGSESNLTVGLNVTNVLNTSYRNYLNRLRYYADDLGRNILLNLKINY
ncbi:MAG: TonB-dependent receptor [Patiriisocius sp.]|uniref:TonB-dependent receptor n=1 Tax=Patiriisocius sp. TaxID=2822396 RepID=UPI003EF0D621